MHSAVGIGADGLTDSFIHPPIHSFIHSFIRLLAAPRGRIRLFHPHPQPYTRHVSHALGLPTVPCLAETAARVLGVARRREYHADGDENEDEGQEGEERAAKGEGAWPPTVRAAVAVRAHVFFVWFWFWFWCCAWRSVCR